MALAMIQFSYKSETVEKLIKNPEDRSVAVKNLIEKLGGKMRALIQKQFVVQSHAQQYLKIKYT